MSGFEYAFVSDVPQEYFCPICECVMREPVQTKCGHRFCKHCLEKSMKRKRKCPFDRRALDERSAKDIYPDVAFERTILDFFVKCPNERYGCKWSGELRSVQTHEMNCNFVGVKCTNTGCEEKFLKKDLNNHVNNICPKRKVECHHCKTLFVLCFGQDHFDECKKYPMDCLQGCRQKIARDKMNDHIEESCPHTKVHCTFAVIGCQVKVQRKAIQEHLKRNTESHSKLVCDRLQDLEAGSTSTLANMEEMQTEISAAMQKIEELWEAVLKSKGLQDLRDKIAATNKKLEKLQSGEVATGALSSLQSEVVAIKKEVEELSTKVANNGKVMELQGAINQLQKSIPKIDILRGLREEVAGINTKLRTLQQAITSLEKRDSHAKSTVCARNDRGALDEIEHVEYELRREFQTQLRYLRERAERDKKEVLDRILAEQEIMRKRILYGFLKMIILILLYIRYRDLFDPFLDIIFMFIAALI